MKKPLTDQEIDRLLKEKFVKIDEQIEVPPVEQQWAKFVERYGLEDNNNKQKPINFQWKYTWVAVLALFVIAMTLIRPFEVTAIGDRLIRSFNLFTGETTRNIVTTETELPPPVIGEEIIATTVDQETTLAEAQKLVYFKIAEPSYLPPKTELEKLLLSQLSADLNKISMHYQVGNGYLSFVQRNVFGDTGDSFLYDTDDASVSEISVGGKKGYKVKAKDGTATLFWRDRGLVLELSGNIAESELLKIAESVK